MKLITNRAAPRSLFLLSVCVLLWFGLPAPVGAQEMLPPSPADRTAELTARLKAIIGPRKLAVAVVPVGALHGVAAVSYQGNEQYPVASSFKGPVAIYFLEFVDPSIWSSVPVVYWSVRKVERIPEPFRAAWEKHQALLFDLYQMAVLSENDATGRILTYVWKNTTAAALGENPLRAFNNWSRDRIGIGEKSGLRSWLVGNSTCPRCYDSRLEAQPMIYIRRVFYHNNTYSAEDLARYWSYLATTGRALGYFSVAEALMRDQKYGLVRKTTRYYGIEAITKDGYIAPDSENGNGYRISTDAGLLRLPDGEEYAVAFLAFDSGDLLEPAIHAMSQIMLAAQRAEF